MQVQQSANKKQLLKEKNPNIFYNLLFYLTFVVLIWFFIALLIPVVYNSGGYLTPVYSMFNGKITLAPFGIASAVFLGVYLIVAVTSLIMVFKLKTHKYPNIKNKKTNLVYYFILVFMLLLIIGFVIELFIPPTTSKMLSDSVDYYTSCWGYNFTTSEFFHNWVYYFNIVFFSILLFFGFFSILILYKVNKGTGFLAKFKENKEAIKQLIQKVKEARKEKAANREKKKRLLEEEDELLSNLNEIVIDEENKAQISQEVLLEKINERNRIKNKILDNHKEQEKLKMLNKLKSKKREAQPINKRSTKLKKQEIAIPDKELEEIFKNLEID